MIKHIIPNVAYYKRSKTLFGIKVKQGSENLYKEGFTENRVFNLKMLLNDNGEKLPIYFNLFQNLTKTTHLQEIFTMSSRK